MKSENSTPTMRSRIFNRFMGSDKAKRSAENQSGLRTLHDAIAVDDADEVLSDDRKTTKGYRNAMLSGEDGKSYCGPSTGGDDEMPQKILCAGDMHIQHNHPQKPSMLPGLAKLAIGVGLLATGVGAPVAAYMLKDALLPKAGAVFEDKEKDFGIGFFEPKEKSE